MHNLLTTDFFVVNAKIIIAQIDKILEIGCAAHVQCQPALHTDHLPKTVALHFQVAVAQHQIIKRQLFKFRPR